MRQFVAECPLEKNGILTVKNDEKKFHYLMNVLRIACGDMIYVRLLDGTLQAMTVADINTEKKEVVFQVAGTLEQESQSLHARPSEKNLMPEMWLFMFIAKPPKMELIIRQAVECGIRYIVPVAGKFSQKGNIESARKKFGVCAVKNSDKTEALVKILDLQPDERVKRIITQAMEQSGSAVQTKVLPCVSLETAGRLWKEFGGNFAAVLYEQTAGTKNIYEIADCTDKIKKAAVAVGAEGGISPEEIELLQSYGFVPVHFNTNILRCETAALYGIAALQTVIMEKEQWQVRE